MVQVNHNTEEHPAETPFDVLPPGEYVVVLDKAERKALKDERKGARLACEFTVIEGDAEGRKLFGSFNLWYKDPDDAEKGEKTKRISEAQFSALINACGLVAVGDTDELIGIPVVAVVKVRPASGTYDAQNEIKTFKLRDGSTAKVGAAQKSTGDATKPARTGASWRK